MLSRRALTLMLAASLTAAVPVQSAQAGPLIDWLFGSHRAPSGPAVPVGSPYAVGYAPTVGGYVPLAGGYPVVSAGYSAAMPNYGYSGYGYSAARPVIPAGALGPAQTLPTTLVPTPVTTVPDYRSTMNRTPVTYYRPVLTTDPNTGAQVVTLSPCSSYEYQTQRVPTWGLTQVFNGGATLPATVAPTMPSAPLMTVPRGGVQLAGPLPAAQSTASYGVYPSTGLTFPTTTPLSGSGSIITPVNPSAYAPVPATSPYSTGLPNYSAGYGSYSTLQPGYGGTGTYPTTPYSSNTYSAVPSCGSTGSAALPSTALPGVGGLPSTVAPVGPSSVTPVYPGASNPSYPGSFAPSTALPGTSSVLPPTGAGAVLPPSPGTGLPSADPNASTLPVLPASPPVQLQSGAKFDSSSRLRAITREPLNSTADRSGSTAGSASPAPLRESAKPNSDSPALMPIPLPSDYNDEPRWNPGLLSEQDQTAMRSSNADARIAAASGRAVEEGAYKPIQWAAYVSSKPTTDEVRTASADRGLELTGPTNTTSSAGSSTANTIRPSETNRLPADIVPLGPASSTPSASVLKPQSQATPAGGELRIGGDTGSMRITPPRTTSSGSAGVEPITQPKPPAVRSRYSTDGWKK